MKKMKKRVIKLNESDLQRMVKRIIREEKKSLNELGGMEDSHPIFGKMNLSKLSDEDIEMLRRYLGPDYRKEPDMEDIVNTSNDFVTDDGDFEHGTFDHKPCKHCGGLGYNDLTDTECRWCGGSGEMKSNPLDESEKWIQDAIKKPGSLRRKMGTHKGENIPSEKIKSKMSSLRKKDRDKKEPGIQGLSKDDLSTYRQIMLAKRMKKYKS